MSQALPVEPAVSNRSQAGNPPPTGPLRKSGDLGAEIFWEKCDSSGTGPLGSVGGTSPAPCHPQWVGGTQGLCTEPQSSELARRTPSRPGPAPKGNLPCPSVSEVTRRAGAEATLLPRVLHTQAAACQHRAFGPVELRRHKCAPDTAGHAHRALLGRVHVHGCPRQPRAGAGLEGRGVRSGVRGVRHPDRLCL